MSLNLTLFTESLNPPIEITPLKSPDACSQLWVQESKKLLFFVPAEGSANAHVTQDGAGNARREAIRRRMAAGTLLLKYALALAFLLYLSLLRDSVVRWRGSRIAVPGYGKSECGGKRKCERRGEKSPEIHFCFPFHAGNRKR